MSGQTLLGVVVLLLLLEPWTVQAKCKRHHRRIGLSCLGRQRFGFWRGRSPYCLGCKGCK